MKRIFVWGTGKIAKLFSECITDKASIEGYIDNNIRRREELFEGKRIVSLDQVQSDDLIIVAIKEYEPIEYQISNEEKYYPNVIYLYKEGDEGLLKKIESIDYKQWKIIYLEDKIEQQKRIIENAVFEDYEWVKNNNIWFPVIRDDAVAIDKIINEGCSLIRFGDGEFETILGRNRAPFQDVTEDLADRLKSVLQNKDDKLLIAIADIYGSLEQYTDMTASRLRNYLSREVRREHLSLLDKNKEYYDANIFKIYMAYKNKEKTGERVHAIKSIWNNKDVVVIEGEKTRSGVGNDLLANAQSIVRILAPTKNAFSVYKELYNEALNQDKSKLILIALGPAGKVLALDLFKNGFQVVDIGQIDMDYDWWKVGAGCRVPNPYKYVSQLPVTEVLDINDADYENQIIARIL